MRVIGLLGGMSWESTVPYYRLINEAVRARLGGHHSAPLVLYSVDFDEIERMQREDRWDDAGAALGRAAAVLEDGDRAEVHRVIYEELCQGRILDVARRRFLAVIDRLLARGAEGVIFGCTEISLLIDPVRVRVPAFDSTQVHAEQAVAWALAAGA